MLKLIACLSIAFAFGATTTEEQNWNEWKNKTFKKALSSPTSFLNAYSLSQAQKGESLYLVVSKDVHKTKWVKTKPKRFFAVAESLGDRIRVKINDRTEAYLSLEKNQRKKEFKLSNGAIARVVFGRRNKKLWAYLFDPQQIKKFTGFRFYPYNLNAVKEGFFKETKTKSVGYRTVQGDSAQTFKVGNVSFQFDGQQIYLPVYSWSDPPRPTQVVEVIFTDGTAGTETYGGGRGLTIRLDSPLRDGQKLKLDFNKTTNFYCAHSPFWHCPVGLQKRVPVKLNAGEMLPLKKIVNR